MNKKGLLLFILFGVILFILFANISPKAGSIICTETSISKECVDITTNTKTLEVYGLKYKNDSGKYNKVNMSLVGVDKLKDKTDAAYGIETSYYKVYIDNNKHELRFLSNGDIFTIKTKFNPSIAKDNYVIYNIDLNTQLKYTFNENKIEKLITINKMDKIDKDYVYTEEYTYINNNNSFNIDKTILIWDSNNTSWKLNLTYTDKLTTITIPLSILTKVVFPLYIDPSLNIDGTSTYLGGWQNYDSISIVNNGRLFINDSFNTLTLNVSGNISIDSTSSLQGYTNLGSGGGPFANNGMNLTIYANELYLNGNINVSSVLTGSSINQGFIDLFINNISINNSGNITNLGTCIPNPSNCQVNGGRIFIQSNILNNNGTIIQRGSSSGTSAGTVGLINISSNTTILNGIITNSYDQGNTVGTAGDIYLRGINFTMSSTGQFTSICGNCNGAGTNSIILTGDFISQGKNWNTGTADTTDNGPDEGTYYIYARDIITTTPVFTSYLDYTKNLGKDRIILNATRDINISVSFNNTGTNAKTAVILANRNIWINNIDVSSKKNGAGESHTDPAFAYAGTNLNITSQTGNIFINGSILAMGGNGGSTYKTGASGGSIWMTARKGYVNVTSIDSSGGTKHTTGDDGAGGFIFLEAYNYLNLRTGNYYTKSGTSSGTAPGGNITHNYCLNYLYNSTATYDVTGTPNGNLIFNNSHDWCNANPIPILISPIDSFSSNNYNQTFICNLSDIEGFLTNSTLYVYNSTGSIVTSNYSSITGYTNQTTNNFTFTYDDIYKWNCLVCDGVNQCKFATNYTLNLNQALPIVNLNYPSDNQAFNYSSNIYFNFTAVDSNGLSRCDLYSNFNGSWAKNFSWFTPTNNTMNYTIINLTEGSYIWNVYCNDTLNNIGYSIANKTLYVDLNYPQLAITSPSGTVTSLTFNILINATDNVGLNYCYYNITNPGQTIIYTSNTRISNCNNISSGVSTDLTTYMLNVFINDSVNHVNVTNQTFYVDTTVPPAPSGGGGGGTPVNQTELLEGFCGNRICESKYNETYTSCPSDCTGNLEPITSCFSLKSETRENCILLKGTALTWVFLIIILVLVFITFFDIKTSSSKYKSSTAVFSSLNIVKRKKR
jgi:hypothetical protein